MALSNPALFLKSHSDGCAVIPAGATNAVGMLGTVRAGLELAAQVRTGEIPAPKRIYAALGTGGTVAGLSIGLAMGGLETEIHAITTVETILSTRYHFNKIISNTRKLLVEGGHKSAATITPSKVIIIRNYLGAGYGHPTMKSLEAMEILKKDGITIEPVYTGKAAAAMIDDLKGGYSEPVLFWNSMRSSLPEIKEGWKDKLPENLRKKLDEQTRNN